MPQSGFRVEGLTRAVRQLQEVGLEVDDLKSAFSQIAREAAQVASAAAPRRTGALAGDIRGNRAKSKAVVIAGRARIKYAGPINYGWPRRGIRGAFFMQHADQVMRPRVVPMLENEINRIIREKGF